MSTYICKEIIIGATATTQMNTKINPQAEEKGPNYLICLQLIFIHSYYNNVFSTSEV